MIQRIELWDFESHEHTVLDNISPALNLICGESNSGKCLTGDTVILDKDGSLRTILDMFKQGEWVVPSLSSGGRFSFEMASCVAANGNKPVFSLETRKGRRIRATGNHRFFTPEGPSGTWRRLDTLRAGDWVAIARRLPVFGEGRLPDGHARLIGYLLGDGGTINNLSFTNEEDDVLDDFKRLVLTLGDHHFGSVPAGKATTVTVSKSVGACGLRTFCMDYGLMGAKNNNKRIPDVVFTSRPEDIIDVLTGLLITDGWVCRSSGNANSFQVGFSTTSKVLAFQISHLLTRFGIVSLVRRKKTTWEYLGEKKKGWSYSIEVSGQRFVKKIGETLGCDFVGKKSKLLREAIDSYDGDRVICRYDVVPRTKLMIERIRSAIRKSGKAESEIKNIMGVHSRTSLTGHPKNESFGLVFLDRLANATGSQELRGVVDSDLYWDRVKSVKPDGVEPTFDLEVPATHTFFANDIYTHNTSIVRALKLAAYNDFNPKSVRVGAAKCVVQVDTERGRVKVTRGPKHNAWEVTRTGQPTQYFDKVGVNIVPDAAEIIGLNIVTLGDVHVPVNIMDQLESHFMLAGIGDKDATGSMRAQIVDEISGLSGIEGLIKAVSLDHHRFGRDIRETEDQMEQVRSQLYPEGELDKEAGILADAERELKDYADMVACIADAESMSSEASVTAGQIEDVSRRLAEIPNAELALQEVSRADDSLRRAALAEALSRSGKVSGDRLSLVSRRLSEIPDTQRVSGLIAVAEDSASKANAAASAYARHGVLAVSLERNRERLKWIGRALEASRFVSEAEGSTSKANAAMIAHERWKVLFAGIEKARTRLEWIGRALEASGELKSAQGALDLCGPIQKLLGDSQVLAVSLSGIGRKIGDNGKRLEDAMRERDEILASVKTCPLTLRPVSKECLA